MPESIPQTFKRCTKCGIEYPATNDYFYKNGHNREQLQAECKLCTRKRSADYRENNHEQCIKTVQDWRDNNIEKSRQISSNYYYEHRDERIEYANSYGKNHRQERREYEREYWGKNRQKQRAKGQSREARKRGLPHDFTVNDWIIALEYFEYRCAYCGNETREMEQEHFIPLSKGGGYTPGNIIPVCKSCNASRQNKDIVQWLAKRYNPHDTQIILYKITQYFNFISTAPQQGY